MITRCAGKKAVTPPISALVFLPALVLIAVEITDITVNVTP